MTIDDVPNVEEAESPSPSISPRPDNIPATVSIGLPTGAVQVGVPARITLSVSRGTSWILRNNAWEPVPLVTFTEMDLEAAGHKFVDNSPSAGNGASFPVTFPHTGTPAVAGWGVTTTGQMVRASTKIVTVVAPFPPAFTWVAPADRARVDVSRGPAQVEVRLSTGTNQSYPFAVTIGHDGTSTSAQHTGTNYAKTITLSPAPLGPREISVTCTDPGGKATQERRTVIVDDGLQPAVAIDDFDPVITVPETPFTVTFTGTTAGAAAGVNGVRYRILPETTSVLADGTGPTGNEWSSWRAGIRFPSSGTYTFEITATDNQGASANVSASITLQV